jgi:ABC-type amino acid transport substrate-binding protein
VFSDDNKTLLGSEADIARLVADSLGLEVNVVPTSWDGTARCRSFGNSAIACGFFAV